MKTLDKEKRKYIVMLVGVLLAVLVVYLGVFNTKYTVKLKEDGTYCAKVESSTAFFAVVPNTIQGKEVDYVYGYFNFFEEEECPFLEFAYIASEKEWLFNNSLSVGIPYSFIICDDGAELVEYYGDEDDIVVPDSVLGRPVVYIYDGCFAGVKDTLKSIVLPDTMECVSSHLFREYKNLERVEGENVTVLDTESFCGCEKLNEVLFPKLEEVGHATFFRCGSLTKLETENPLKIIRSDAFRDSVIEYVYFDEYTEIRSGAFENTPWREINQDFYLTCVKGF